MLQDAYFLKTLTNILHFKALPTWDHVSVIPISHVCMAAILVLMMIES